METHFVLDSAGAEAWASGTTRNFYAQEITESKSGRPGRQYFAEFPATTLGEIANCQCGKRNFGSL